MRSSPRASVSKLANGLYRITHRRADPVEPFVHCGSCGENIPLEGVGADQVLFEHVGELHD